jgi:predicted porin
MLSANQMQPQMWRWNMIGGLKKTASAFAIAAAAGLMSTSAMAADLGGNCCADLEERVAELEATTVRKGNRRVSLTLSGHVNESLLFWDDGINSGMQITTNLNSQTRFRFRGSAKINSDWSAGYYIEFGLGGSGNSNGVSQDDVRNLLNAGAGARQNNVPTIRHHALYIQSQRLGTLWLGHTTDAVDGLQDICVGCPITSSIEMLSWHGFQAVQAGAIVGSGVTWSQLGIGNEGYFADRVSVLKYISPTIAGFSLTASINDANETDLAYDVDGVEHGYDWDIALRYANEFNGVRVAWGVGYSENTNVDGLGNDGDSWVIAGSMQHVPTGLFIQANYKESEGRVCGTCDHEAWSVTAGIVRKFSPLGATTFWGQYSNYETTSATGFADGDVIAFGINQQIDAAAMELYLTYWNVQGDIGGETFRGLTAGPLRDSNFVMAGAMIRF